jgi:hypothetical protein
LSNLLKIVFKQLWYSRSIILKSIRFSNKVLLKNQKAYLKSFSSKDLNQVDQSYLFYLHQLLNTKWVIMKIFYYKKLIEYTIALVRNLGNIMHRSFDFNNN